MTFAYISYNCHLNYNIYDIVYLLYLQHISTLVQTWNSSTNIAWIGFYKNVIFRHIQLYDVLLQKGLLSFSVQPFYRDIMNRLTRTSVSRFLAAPYLLLLLCRHVSLYCSPYLFVLLSIFRRTRYCCVTVNFHMGGGNKFCPDYLQRQSCKMLFF